MNKELVTRLATGAIAKLVRYALLSSGVLEVNGGVQLTPGGTTYDVNKIALGAAGIIVPLVWSFIEDRIKKRQAAGLPAATQTPPTP